MPAIPELESAEYLITKKEVKYKKLTAAARNKLYQQVVAQMALRTLRCVFATDREFCRRQKVSASSERSWDAYEAERYRGGERDTRPGYTENPFRTVRQQV